MFINYLAGEDIKRGDIVSVDIMTRMIYKVKVRVHSEWEHCGMV